MDILGLWPGRLVGLLYLLFILVLASTTIRELGEIINVAFLPQTPKIIIVLIGVLLSTYIVISGLEVINRVFCPWGSSFWSL